MVHEADKYWEGLRTDEGDAVEHLPQDGALSRAHARTNAPDETKSERSIFEVIAILVCFLSLVALGLLVMWIWNGWLYQSISLDQFLGLRKVLAILVVVYAMLSVGRLIGQATTQGAFPRKFVPELIAFSAFWILVPPIWFFVEYFAVQSDCFSGLPWLDKGEYLKTIKDYADYASKIWAGVLALLAALIALKR